ncbi:type I methionyl aminopeptidase [Carboxylicivirga sp. M1479]|uniref:type I methionyl aminopeptidase n=1 Tax=Carboxylicivirga sp. M1479 TaxID=2594476 RepID=UPI0011774B43|nr:type I methionyl aminopeptidase [Carboxylicivirga sp. M1479]TRX65745.1 type I methionyl aminopeptidase [Carboxylicivirga sp. M1479]
MIYLKTDEEIELMRISNQLVAKTLGEVAKAIKPGVSTLELDKIAETFIRDNGGTPAFLNYQGFPNTLCTSVNEHVVHGIPSDKPLQEGDIVSVDCGVLLNDFYGDSAYTFPIGQVAPEVKALLDATKESLYKGIEQAIENNRLGDIGNAIQTYTEDLGYTVVREMVGHGIGKNLHEAPEVANYGKKGNGTKLKTGMVIAIEPMINLGKRQIVQEDDGWTIRTIDNKVSAHYEHTVAIRKGKADILSSFKFVEEILSLQSEK